MQITQNTKDNELKGKMMNIHKSFGVLMASLVVPRIALRLTTLIPAYVLSDKPKSATMHNNTHW